MLPHHLNTHTEMKLKTLQAQRALLAPELFAELKALRKLAPTAEDYAKRVAVHNAKCLELGAFLLVIAA